MSTYLPVAVASAQRRHTKPIRKARTSAGFGLVELMIALVLGLVLVAAMGQLYSGTRQTSRTSQALAELNESGRFAVDFLSSDIRMAGYLSCGAPSRGFTALRTTVDSEKAASDEKWLYELDRNEGFAIRGFEANPVPPAAFGDRLPATDVIVIRRALTDLDRDLKVHSSDATTLTLSPSPHGFQRGEVLVVSSPGCDQTSVFQVTAVTSDSVSHTDSSSVVPGNCTNRLFGDVDCPNSLGINQNYKADSAVSRYTVHGYYVRNSDPPALMRVRLTYPGDPAAEAGTPYVKEELLAGVENLQILYGVTEGSSLIVDDYMTADQIEASTDINWRDVLSVRFALLIRSREPNVRTDGAGQIHDLLGMLDPSSAVKPTDRHLRKTFGEVVALRNAIP